MKPKRGARYVKYVSVPCSVAESLAREQPIPYMASFLGTEGTTGYHLRETKRHGHIVSRSAPVCRVRRAE
jgi:hypothetical protein